MGYIKAMTKCEDPLERMKILTSGVIGKTLPNLLKSGGKGPLNPILGETYSVKTNDGCEIYLE